MADGSNNNREVGRTARKPRTVLRIGLVNNMPDAAVEATERQFRDLVRAAAGSDFDIDFRLYTLRTMPRGDVMRRAMDSRYASLEALRRCGADGVIVTGNEPRADDLREEPYWEELGGLIDWARVNTASSIWSCLAAHAAVLHLSGIPRRRLPAKLSGVFSFNRVADGGLTAGAADVVRRPHSRHNGLLTEDLAACGYQVLTQSARAGVDVFVREDESLLVFLQGHPEYDGDSLMREYRRDVSRYLRGEHSVFPTTPEGYFDADTERSLAAFSERALWSRAEGQKAWSDDFAPTPPATAPWRADALQLIRNWLGFLATATASSRRTTASRATAP